MRVVLSLFLATCLLFLGPNSHARVYKWVDGDGQVHYSSKKPPGAEAETVKLKRKPPPPPKAAVTEAPAAEEPDADQQWARCDQPLCERARKVEYPECKSMCAAALQLSETCREKARIVCAVATNDLQAQFDKDAARSNADSLRKAESKMIGDLSGPADPQAAHRAKTAFEQQCVRVGKSLSECKGMIASRLRENRELKRARKTSE